MTWRQEQVIFKCADILIGLVIIGKIPAAKEVVDICKALQIELYNEFGKPFDETK